ncbi:MAG: metal ABC transporter ATP-binding protein [Deltaproteobacteria bacterium]|nr:MAG: metal ABC transporter ATP-binding protein [Deltaproteobacteria bacterium]
MSRPALELDGVSVRFGALAALEDLTLTVPEGAFVSIVGPNGAGKSTLFRLILGLLTPTSGRIRVLGRAPRTLPRGALGYVPQLKTQDRSFPALSIELVVTGLTGRWPVRIDADQRVRAMAALDQVGAGALAQQPIRRLSGGQLQRIYLARALASHPKMLLLDEPGTGIDTVGMADLHHALEDYQHESKGTVLMVTHDWEAAYHHATHVLLLARECVAFGPPAEALAEANLRRAYGHTEHHHETIFQVRRER